MKVAHVVRVRTIATGSLTVEDCGRRCLVGKVDGSLIHVTSQHGQSFGESNTSIGSSSVVWVVAERAEEVVDVESGIFHQGVVAGAVVVVHGRGLDRGVSIMRLARSRVRAQLTQ